MSKLVEIDNPYELVRRGVFPDKEALKELVAYHSNATNLIDEHNRLMEASSFQAKTVTTGKVVWLKGGCCMDTEELVRRVLDG